MNSIPRTKRHSTLGNPEAAVLPVKKWLLWSAMEKTHDVIPKWREKLCWMQGRHESYSATVTDWACNSFSWTGSRRSLLQRSLAAKRSLRWWSKTIHWTNGGEVLEEARRGDAGLHFIDILPQLFVRQRCLGSVLDAWAYRTNSCIKPMGFLVKFPQALEYQYPLAVNPQLGGLSPSWVSIAGDCKLWFSSASKRENGSLLQTWRWKPMWNVTHQPNCS